MCPSIPQDNSEQTIDNSDIENNASDITNTEVDTEIITTGAAYTGNDSVAAYQPDQTVSKISRQSMLTLTEAFKRLSQTAALFSLSQAIMAGGVFGSMAIIGRLSEAHLAASDYMYLFQALGLHSSTLVIYSVGIETSILKAQKAYTHIGDVMRNGHYTAVIASIPAIFFTQFSRHILLLLGENEQNAYLTGQYFFPYFIVNIPGIMLFTNYQQFLFATDHNWTAIFYIILNTGITTGLGYLMTNFADNHWVGGVRGVPFAMMVSSGVTLACCYLTMKLKYFNGYNVSQLINWPDLKHIGRLLSLGIPISFQMGTEAFGFYLTGVFIGWMGDRALAAAQVTTQNSLIQSVPIFSVGHATGLIAGAENQRSPRNGRVVASAGVMMTTAYTGLCFALSVALPRYLSYPFINSFDPDNEPVINTAKHLLLINGMAQIMDGVRHNIAGALRGYESTKFAMISGMITMAVLSSVGAYLFDDDVDNIFWFRLGMISLGALIVSSGFHYYSKLAIEGRQDEPSYISQAVTKVKEHCNWDDYYRLTQCIAGFFNNTETARHLEAEQTPIMEENNTNRFYDSSLYNNNLSNM